MSAEQNEIEALHRKLAAVSLIAADRSEWQDVAGKVAKERDALLREVAEVQQCLRRCEAARQEQIMEWERELAEKDKEIGQLRDGMMEIFHVGASSNSRDYMKCPDMAERFIKGEASTHMQRLVESHMVAHAKTAAERDDALAKVERLKAMLIRSKRHWASNDEAEQWAIEVDILLSLK